MTTVKAAIAFALLAIGMTWPIAMTATHDLPGDLGDPVFVSWVLARGSDHWLQLLGGDPSALLRFWQAGIFFPEPNATAFSEHFLLHALLTLPVWLATRNVLLCYNVLWIASFALSGLTMFLLVRELTGRPRAAFVAGLLFAFLPYRVSTLSHLQVLSSYWMPLALLGLHRFLASGRIAPLVGGVAALWAQSLSSGYYLVFFGPFVGLFSLVGMWAHGRLRSLKTWVQLTIGGAAAIAATLPFAMPYLRVQERYRFRRPLQEIEFFSADLMGWFTANDRLNLWGQMRPFVRAEGELFPGLTLVACFAAGLALSWWGLLRARDSTQRLLAVFGLVGAFLAFWLALGPKVTIETQPTGLPALYLLFYDYVPGYDVARVPSRFAMILFLIMAMVGGRALAALEASRARALLWAIAVFVLVEGSAAPIATNYAWTSYPGEFTIAGPRVYPEREAPRVYRYLKTLPDTAVVAHFPFGLPEREIQYVFYSAIHGKPIINGYSGAFPPVYVARLPVLRRPFPEFARAAEQLRFDGVTHIVVHTAAWEGDMGRRTLEGFESVGFRRLAHFGDDYVLASPDRR